MFKQWALYAADNERPLPVGERAIEEFVAWLDAEGQIRAPVDVPQAEMLVRLVLSGGTLDVLEAG